MSIKSIIILLKFYQPNFECPCINKNSRIVLKGVTMELHFDLYYYSHSYKNYHRYKITFLITLNIISLLFLTCVSVICDLRYKTIVAERTANKPTFQQDNKTCLSWKQSLQKCYQHRGSKTRFKKCSLKENMQNISCKVNIMEKYDTDKKENVHK